MKTTPEQRRKIEAVRDAVVHLAKKRLRAGLTSEAAMRDALAVLYTGLAHGVAKVLIETQGLHAGRGAQIITRQITEIVDLALSTAAREPMATDPTARKETA